MNAEAAARAKRERRRANELKTRTIQRMQLQMTAPIDIGMEQNDLSLRGQDDIFDLEETERGLRKRVDLSALGEEVDGDSSADEETDEDKDEEILDSEGERERKVGYLEAELNGLYDAYQERMRERDAKFKVKEARMNSKDRDEWAGIQKTDSDNEDSEDEEGGYHVMERAKEQAGEDSDSDDSDIEDSGRISLSRLAKRPRIDDVAETSQWWKKARTDTAPLARGKEALSQNAQVWFSQGLFKGTGLSDVEDDEEEEKEDIEMVVDEDSGVEMGDGASQTVGLLILLCCTIVLTNYRYLQITMTTSRLFLKTNPTM